jgi:hypothetical protein
MQLDAAPDAVGDTAGDSFGVMASSPSPMLAFSFFFSMKHSSKRSFRIPAQKCLIASESGTGKTKSVQEKLLLDR